MVTTLMSISKLGLIILCLLASCIPSGSAQRAGWNLSPIGGSCAQACGTSSSSSLVCVPSAQNAIDSKEEFLAVASSLGVTCANNNAQRGGLSDLFDPSFAVFQGQIACFFKFGGTSSTCDSTFGGDTSGFGPAVRLCCCANTTTSATACPTTGGSSSNGTASGTLTGGGSGNGTGSGTGSGTSSGTGGGGTSTGSGSNLVNNDNDCPDGDFLCVLLTIGSILFDFILGFCT